MLLRMLLSVGLLIASLPDITATIDQQLTKDLCGFVGLDHLLQTTVLDIEHLVRVRSCLSSLSQGLLAKRDSYTVVVDSGASSAGTTNINDFIPGTYEKFVHPKHMPGISGRLPILGVGRVKWEVVMDNGKIQQLTPQAFHIPGLPIHLLSPQDLVSLEGGQKGASSTINGNCLFFFSRRPDSFTSTMTTSLAYICYGC